jgi:hypothetical protein
MPQRLIDMIEERVSRTECPFCEADDWTDGRLIEFPMKEIADLAPNPRLEEKRLATVLWICGNCGFIRAHSVAPELAFG